MDSFVEQIVVKKKTFTDYLAIVGTVLLAIVLMVACWLFLTPFFLAVAFAGGFGIWWMVVNRSYEYEYCITNGDVDVDKIIGKRKRERVVSVVGRKVEKLMPYETGMDLSRFQRFVMAAPSLKEEGLWYFTYHSKKNGNTCVVFQPDERVLKALYGGLQKLVQMDTARAMRDRGISED